MIYGNLDFGQINLRKKTSYIIICDTKADNLNVVNYHNHCIDNKKLHGIPYHYIVRDNGEIYNCKPVSYVFELYKSFDNDICIAIDGDLNEYDMTDKQRESFTNLVCELLEKECLSFSAVKLLSDLVGGYNPGNRPNWQEIKKDIKNIWISKDKFRKPLLYIDSDSKLGASKDDIDFCTVGKNENIDRLAHFVGTDIENIKSPKDLYKPQAIPMMFFSAIKLPTNPEAFGPSLTMLYKNNIVSQVNKFYGQETKAVAGILDMMDNKIAEVGRLLKVENRTATSTTQTKFKGIDNIPNWCDKDINLPGYSKARLSFTNIRDNSVTTIPFVISPSSFNDNRGIQQQISKTTTGWFAMKLGQQITTISLTGYMLDTDSIKERQAFITAYNSYIRDSKDFYFRYKNDYITSLYIEGRTYTGIVQSIGLAKSALQQFLYQYNINFMCFSESSPFADMSKLISQDIFLTNGEISKSNEAVKGEAIVSNAILEALKKVM